MATLNEIAYDLAYHINASNNLEQIRRIKYNVHIFRSMLIRQDIARHHPSVQYQQTIGCIELDSVDAGECCEVCTGLTFMKSKLKVPKPINLYTTTPFIAVMDLKYSNSYSYVESQLLNLKMGTQKYGNPKYYFLENDYLHITTTAKKIKVTGIFENPSDLNIFKCGDESTKPCFTDDDEYPASGDIVARMSMAILQGKFRLQPPPETQEVVLNK